MDVKEYSASSSSTTSMSFIVTSDIASVMNLPTSYEVSLPTYFFGSVGLCPKNIWMDDGLDLPEEL